MHQSLNRYYMQTTLRRVETACVAAAMLGIGLRLCASLAAYWATTSGMSRHQDGASLKELQAIIDSAKGYEPLRQVGLWLLIGGTTAFVVAHVLKKWSERGDARGSEAADGPGNKAWFALTAAGLVMMVLPLVFWPMIENRYRAKDLAAIHEDAHPDSDALVATAIEYAAEYAALQSIVTIAGIGAGPLMAMSGVWLYQRSKKHRSREVEHE
jgi:hypothetical protein